MTSLAGSFLVAKPILPDPNFAQTVVLMLRHNDEGAFGLIVNRPTKSDAVPFPVYVGGPCKGEGLILLHGHADWAAAEDEPAEEVAPGVYLGDAECLQRATDREQAGEAARFRVFVGYSGWGPDQLESELAAGAWIITPASGELVFDTPIDQLWDRLSPPAIPKPSAN
jgi:putative transcriptional regulator